MTGFFLILAVTLALLAVLAFYRVIAGPTIFDRLVGVGVMGTKTVVLLCIIGFLYERIDMFVDIAIGYALLNFIGTLAASKYFERKRELW